MKKSALLMVVGKEFWKVLEYTFEYFGRYKRKKKFTQVFFITIYRKIP